MPFFIAVVVEVGLLEGKSQPLYLIEILVFSGWKKEFFEAE
jgi:hypothetical protein